MFAQMCFLSTGGGTHPLVPSPFLGGGTPMSGTRSILVVPPVLVLAGGRGYHSQVPVLGYRHPQDTIDLILIGRLSTAWRPHDKIILALF